MKKSTMLIATALLATGVYAQEATEVKYVQNVAIAKQGMAQAKGLIMSIKPALMAAMKKDKSGIEATMMCSQSAQEMGKSYAKTLPKGSSIRRTALKYRNPNNKPDATDVAVMEKIVAEGNFTKPFVVDMGENFRVYKTLPTHKPCLACHGDKEKMPEKMKEILEKNYPADLATGFKEHEFRGVIVSTIEK
jgi:hypothetical protein